MKLMQAKELEGAMEGRKLVDVRTPAEFEEIHIPGSRLVPLHQLGEQAVHELSSGEGSCVLVCRSGNRAKQAAEKLMAAGCKDLVILEGGVSAWEAAGLPVNRGRKTISIERQVRIGAGALVVTGVVLGALVNPLFTILSGFVGCGLIFAGITNWCGMGLLLARMPWNNRGGSCCAEGGASCAR
jgi:rhodanese-related sulfurtransferase